MTKFIDFSKLRKNEDKERKLKEYIKEYQRVCNTITEDDIYHKQIILEYNDGVPDMFIEISIEGNEFINSIMYDIYNLLLYISYIILFMNSFPSIGISINISGTSSYSSIICL